MVRRVIRDVERVVGGVGEWQPPSTPLLSSPLFVLLLLPQLPRRYSVATRELLDAEECAQVDGTLDCGWMVQVFVVEVNENL